MACLMKKVGGGASSTPITKVYILYPIYPSPIPSPSPPLPPYLFLFVPVAQLLLSRRKQKKPVILVKIDVNR